MEKTSEQKIDMSKYWIKKYTRRINGEQKHIDYRLFLEGKIL